MRATVFYAPGDVRIENVPDPKIQQPTDAIVRVQYAGICGSDLWFYRGEQDYKKGWRTGHELMGIVEDVGKEVRTLKKGNRTQTVIHALKRGLAHLDTPTERSCP